MTHSSRAAGGNENDIYNPFQLEVGYVEPIPLTKAVELFNAYAKRTTDRNAQRSLCNAEVLGALAKYLKSKPTTRYYSEILAILSGADLPSGSKLLCEMDEQTLHLRSHKIKIISYKVYYLIGLEAWGVTKEGKWEKVVIKEGVQTCQFLE